MQSCRRARARDAELCGGAAVCEARGEGTEPGKVFRDRSSGGRERPGPAQRFSPCAASESSVGCGGGRPVVLVLKSFHGWF